MGNYTFHYDDDLMLESTDLISGSDIVTTEYHYNQDGLLITCGPFTFTRDSPSVDPTHITDGNLDLSLTYDGNCRIESRTFTINGIEIYSVGLFYNNIGQIHKKIEVIEGVSYEFDYTYENGSLASVLKVGSGIEHYTYYSNGNRKTRQIAPNPEETCDYDLRDFIKYQGNTSYDIIDNGYMEGRGTDQFNYGSFGELLSATVNGSIVTYSYDGLGRRVGRSDSAGKYLYFYGNPDNNLQVTAIRDPSGALSVYYYDEGGRLFAVRRDNILYYVVTDHLGTPLMVVNQSGNIIKIIQYNAFGRMISDNNPNFDLPIGFAGGLTDPNPNIKLVHFGFRDYETDSGRWTGRDPILFSGRQSNIYSYVNNDPINSVDPTGLFTFGASFYDVVGGGFKISYHQGQLGFCAETGVGIGASIEATPSDIPVGDHLYLTADVAGTLGDLARVGITEELDMERAYRCVHCGDCKTGKESALQGGPYACIFIRCTTEKGVKYRYGMNRRAKNIREIFRANLDTKLGIRAKAVIKYCHGWQL